jgi:hypothetical protein
MVRRSPTAANNSPAQLCRGALAEYHLRLFLNAAGNLSKVIQIRCADPDVYAEPGFDVVVQIPAHGSGFKSDPINRPDNDGRQVCCTLKGNFAYLGTIRRITVQAILPAGD